MAAGVVLLLEVAEHMLTLVVVISVPFFVVTVTLCIRVRVVGGSTLAFSSGAGASVIRCCFAVLPSVTSSAISRLGDGSGSAGLECCDLIGEPKRALGFASGVVCTGRWLISVPVVCCGSCVVCAPVVVALASARCCGGGGMTCGAV